MSSSQKAQPSVAAIIPAYNESRNIASIIVETSKYVSFVIVVDDGSIDNTKEIAGTTNAFVIRNKLNMGKGFALKRGIIECLKYNPDIVVTIDADGQHDPSEIPKLLNPIISEEADVVIGSRYEKESYTDPPFHRRIGLSTLNGINRLLVRSSVKDTQSGYRAYTKNVLSTVLKCDSSGYGVEVEQLAALEGSGFRIVEVPVTIRYKGLENTSKKRPVSHGIHILSAIFRIVEEKQPLYFGLSGLILAGISLYPAALLLAHYNETRYFSLPLGLLTFGFLFVGSMLVLVSLIFYALKRIKQREEIIVTTLLDLLNKTRQ